MRDGTIDGLARASPVTPHELEEAAFRLPTGHGDDVCRCDALFVVGTLQKGLRDALQVLGSGAGRKLRIRFERAGVKTIVVRYAKLEIG